MYKDIVHRDILDYQDKEGEFQKLAQTKEDWITFIQQHATTIVKSLRINVFVSNEKLEINIMNRYRLSASCSEIYTYLTTLTLVEFVKHVFRYNPLRVYLNCYLFDDIKPMPEENKFIDEFMDMIHAEIINLHHSNNNKEN